MRWCALTEGTPWPSYSEGRKMNPGVEEPQLWGAGCSQQALVQLPQCTTALAA